MSIDSNPLFLARLGVNLPRRGSIPAPLGVHPARRKILPQSPASTAEAQRDAAEPRHIAVVSLASTVPPFGIVPAARKVPAKWPGSTVQPLQITVPARHSHPAPRGMRPAAHGEVVLAPQTALQSGCGFSRTTPAHLMRLKPQPL
jgi:hypothetical protein